ncbi:MAG: hypothetical protein ACU0A6_11395 [Shimia sp.]|jgi:hypothetical protein|uniref:hypothetical protein n=1 Tax=Shimia sp. TaxID=1954381 RepID=UPI0040581003
MRQASAQWQLVVILWGTKYGVAEVNRLIETVRSSASKPFRTILITDRERSGLDTSVQTRPFPEFFSRKEMRGPGCQAKLVMFENGIVPDDLPAIYVDIDTVVFGDICKLLAETKTEKGLMLFQSAILPIGPVGRFIAQLTNKRKYARGNSSIVVYHPRECSFVAETFRNMQATYGDSGVRPMAADERFMSWAAQDHLQRIPRHMAVKFPTEFMLPWRWLIRLRGRLPWVRKRWAGLLAVTLPGIEVKGQELLTMAEEAEIVDRKGRILIWSEAAIGPMKARLTEYYRALEAATKEDKA